MSPLPRWRFWLKSGLYFGSTVGLGTLLLKTLVPGDEASRAALGAQGRLIHAPTATESQARASQILAMYVAWSSVLDALLASMHVLIRSWHLRLKQNMESEAPAWDIQFLPSDSRPQSTSSTSSPKDKDSQKPS